MFTNIMGGGHPNRLACTYVCKKGHNGDIVYWGGDVTVGQGERRPDSDSYFPKLR